MRSIELDYGDKLNKETKTMDEIRESKSSTEAHWAKLYRIGAVLLILTAVIWTIVFRLGSNLYASGQPSDAMGYLHLFAQKSALAATDWSLWIVSDILLIPASIAIYFALRRTNKRLALAGTILSLVYCVYDIFVTELSSLILVHLAQGYAGAMTDAVRASIVASANSIVSALPLMTFFSFLIGSVGMLLWSVVMLRNAFGRRLGIFGIIANFLAVLGSLYPLISNPPIVLGIIFVYCIPIVAIWFVLVGIQLLRINKRLTATTDNPNPSNVSFSKSY